MKLKLLSSAMGDLEDGFRFYERQAPGLGVRLFESLFADIDSLLIHAGVHPVHFGYHRMLSRRFPYAIFYSVEDDVVLVRRVFDTRRDPNHIRKELE